MNLYNSKNCVISSEAKNFAQTVALIIKTSYYVRDYKKYNLNDFELFRLFTKCSSVRLYSISILFNNERALSFHKLCGKFCLRNFCHAT